ncbi:E3 ubiquitin protein ligase DRIP2-like isoform X1 [Andrographis paniculata]|uniref:E3 ubiquitin protein ligase DRIP2-like isoform X1 n=1 Tax=Andrographis paniculata TaxID=175694 RepID=UPI0021E75BEA|nr:E3 ubiquitin protein ligase DRIP2-like isoform X1 [Andrographis paniculata]
MPHQAVNVKREALAPCMTCPICHKLLRDATTIIECLHTFCRKCIYKKLDDEEMECCPKCNIDLGCVPLEKLRPDHTVQDVRAKLFPDKRVQVKATEDMSPVSLPAKRKERSLSSLVVSTPRVSTHVGMTGRRSKFITRKASKGSSFNIEKTAVNSVEDDPESCSSPEMLNKYMRQKAATGEPSNNPTPDKGKENGSEHRDGKYDLWKPLNCLVEAANRSKPSKYSLQGSRIKSEELNSFDGNDFLSRFKEPKKKAKVKDEKNRSPPPESERPKKVRKPRQKAQDFGELRIPPQAVLDAASAELGKRNCPIWFSLVASDEWKEDATPLPQIPTNYLRIKDGNIPVSFIQKYLKRKLNLATEDEIDIKCMGQTVVPTLPLNTLVDLWLQTNGSGRVSATIGSSAKEFIMVLGYARRAAVP